MTVWIMTVMVSPMQMIWIANRAHVQILLTKDSVMMIPPVNGAAAPKTALAVISKFASQMRRQKPPVLVELITTVMA
jgi:hypothetical protein